MTFRLRESAPEMLLLAALAFGPFAFGAAEAWSRAVLEGLLFCAALALAARRAAWRWHPVYRALLPATGVIVALGLLQAMNPRPVSYPASWLPFTADARATSEQLPLWGAYGALLVAAPQAFRSRAAYERLLWALLAIGVVLSVIGLMQKGQGNSAYYGLRPINRGNPFGPYTNKNHAASLLLFSGFAGAGLWLSRVPALLRLEQSDAVIEGWAKQLVLGFFLAVIAYALIVIRSRGALLAAGATLAVMLTLELARWRSARARRIGAAVLGVAAAAAALVVWNDPSWIGIQSQDSSAGYRLALYRNSLEIFRDFPLFGTGLGSYLEAFKPYQNLQMFADTFEHAHNDGVELLVQVGVLGSAAFVAALLRALYAAFASWMRSSSPESRWLAAAGLAGALSFVLHGFVEFPFQIPANAAVFLTCVCALRGGEHLNEPA